MKQFIVYILAFFYCLTASSASLYIHHCQGITAKVSLSDSTEEDRAECPLCADKAAKSCHSKGCNDVRVDLKNTDDSYLASAHAVPFVAMLPTSIPLPWLSRKCFERLAVDLQTPLLEHKLLNIYQIPPYLKNCIFRI
ncbi:hypothetical protein J5U18_05745 [Sphingobacteriaceae bacterium WQ 2009]|uniref:Uncharacterized protein n=1 Tax=Rhinopithecimicrobium faecis TaxID=2820698 RepID=A0A8T4HAB6_9SPHI|nr:hypothetical protein [Sphingobacteriaceae bacterium WQ 2009]